MTYTKENILSILEPKRKKHTIAVMEESIKLAKLYNVKTAKAETAALFHDLCKNMSDEDINKIIDDNNLDKKYKNNNNLAHSKVAAIIMMKKYSILDEDILNAVRFHTTGRAKMSTLEKIIFVADAIEPNRQYLNVEEIRNIAYTNIDNAVLLLLTRTIEYVKNKGKYLDEDTLLGKKYYEKEKQMNNEQLALLAKEVMEDKKAEDVEIIDISLKSSFADYFVIASGTSERQVNSLVDEVEDKFAEVGVLVKSIEGKNNSGWILMDFGDVIVNVFTTEMREKYSLEKIWGDTRLLDIENTEDEE